jgi:hypothetical protein
LRATQVTLQTDLSNVTATMLPPRPATGDEGYFQYTEGPIGPVIIPELTNLATAAAVNSETNEIDTTVGDNDDMLMFTVRSRDRPFVGRAFRLRDPLPTETPDGSDSIGDFKYQPLIVESYEAEVAWFVRGRTLYRRVLLILPAFDADVRAGAPGIQSNAASGYWLRNDLSVRRNGAWAIPNSLSDLTKPQNRFAHQTVHLDSSGTLTTGFPYHPHFTWDAQSYPSAQTTPNALTTPPGRLPLRRSTWAYLGLPTARETSYVNANDPAGGWVAGYLPPIPAWPQYSPPIPNWPNAVSLTPRGRFDAWVSPHPWREIDPVTGTVTLTPPPPPVNQPPPRYLGVRIAEDVVLPNVIGFDVEAWDPAAPIVYDSARGVALMPGDPGYLPMLANSITATLTGTSPNPYPRVSYGGYADLNYMCLLGPDDPDGNQLPLYPLYQARPIYRNAIAMTGETEPDFYGAGDWRSRIRGTDPYVNPGGNPKDFSDAADWPPPEDLRPSVYDTWSDHYERDGIDQNNNGVADEGSNGLDNPQNGLDDDLDGTVDEADEPGVGIVDDDTEAETCAPYRVPLRGVRVKIRVFEPDSRQVREVTIVQDFLPK